MDGRFYDGKSARSHPAVVSVDAEAVTILTEEKERRWPSKGLSLAFEANEARLSHSAEPDARLVVSRSDWTQAGGLLAKQTARRDRSRERRLAIALAVAAAAVTGFVFIGVPALSGPLARATPVEYERNMGRNFDLQMNALFSRCEGEDGQAALQAMTDRLASNADTVFDIRIRAVQAPMINAFALPGGSIIVTDDLIRSAETPDEVAAVVAHEIAHVEKRHVMQAVWRSLGLGLILDAVVGGGSGAGQQAVLLAGQATDLSYGRAAEHEADERGRALLHEAGFSSKGMAAFFDRLSKMEDQKLAEAAEFAATHPASGRRAREARAAERPGAPALSAEDWRRVKSACKAEDPKLRVIRRQLGL
jgi:predicted Zn-dependent protease